MSLSSYNNEKVYFVQVKLFNRVCGTLQDSSKGCLLLLLLPENIHREGSHWIQWLGKSMQSVEGMKGFECPAQC